MTAIMSLVRQPTKSGFSGWRVILLGLTMMAVGALMIYRLVSLQVLDPERLIEHGESQRIRTAALAAERGAIVDRNGCLLYTSPSPRDQRGSRMPSSA